MSGNNIKKVLRTQAREISFNVAQYMKKEADEGHESNVEDVLKRTAIATGIPEKTVRNICAKSVHTSSGLLVMDKKKTIKKKGTYIDDYVLEVIKRCIHNFPHSENQLPTIKQLFRMLQVEINYQGTVARLRRILKDLGFCWKKTDDNKKVFFEKMDIRFKRHQYLETIKKYRSEGRLIIYTGEIHINPADPTDARRLSEGIPKQQKQVTLLHAGSEYGFVPNALYMCKSMVKVDNSVNPEDYEKWLRTQLLPNLPPQSVVVVNNNMSYHKKKVKLTPSSNAKRAEMEKWLQMNHIPYSSKMLKPQLYKLIILNKQPPLYCIDQILGEYNHKVLRLPPFHQDLNPIYLAWGDVKAYILKKNVKLNANVVMDLVKERTNLIGQNEWANFCNETRKLEEEYVQRDHVIDTLTDRIVESGMCIKDEIESEEEMMTEDSNLEINFGQEALPNTNLYLHMNPADLPI